MAGADSNPRTCAIVTSDKTVWDRLRASSSNSVTHHVVPHLGRRSHPDRWARSQGQRFHPVGRELEHSRLARDKLEAPALDGRSGLSVMFQ